ncbi:MAG: hypothetical protein WDL87_09105 [Candidatus Omnitrophota bacterium]|jgi:hypothetical protein
MQEGKIIRIVEGEIENFVKEWAKFPYAWESEADVHAELYFRIKSLLRKNKFRLQKYNAYRDLIDEEYVDWIYCKPKTYIKKKPYYPDILIYRNMGVKFSIKEPDNDPILWACEIKYITDWSSQLSKEGVRNDIRKLKCLLKPKNGGASRSCYLILQRKKKRKEERGYASFLRYDLRLSWNNKILQILRNLKKKDERLKIYCYSIDYKRKSQ